MWRKNYGLCFRILDVNSMCRRRPCFRTLGDVSYEVENKYVRYLCNLIRSTLDEKIVFFSARFQSDSTRPSSFVLESQVTHVWRNFHILDSTHLGWFQDLLWCCFDPAYIEKGVFVGFFLLILFLVMLQKWQRRKYFQPSEEAFLKGGWIFSWKDSIDVVGIMVNFV